MGERMTRDSRIWIIGVVVAIVTGLATLDTQTAVSVGLHAEWLPYLRLAAFVVGIVSGQMGTSPLPHSSEVR